MSVWFLAPPLNLKISLPKSGAQKSGIDNAHEHRVISLPLLISKQITLVSSCIFQTQIMHRGPQDPLVCNKVTSKHHGDFEKRLKFLHLRFDFCKLLVTSTCQRTKLNEFASVVCMHVSLCRGSIKQTLIQLETHRFQASSPARPIISASFVTALSEIPIWTEALCLTLGSHAEASHWLAKIYKTAFRPNSA